MSDDLCYGLDGWERLVSDPDEVIERILDENVCGVGEGFDATAARIGFPIRVYEHRCCDLGGEARAKRIAEDVLEFVLESLDEDYGDPEEVGGTTPTEKMRDAALEFGRAVVADYKPFACELTGEVIEYTREDVKRVYKESYDA